MRKGDSLAKYTTVNEAVGWIVKLGEEFPLDTKKVSTW